MKRAAILIFLFLASQNIFGADMLADISQPVQTPFGLYEPIIVNMTPQAPACHPGENLEHVINASDFSLSADAREFLKKNHFFVAPGVQKNGRGYNEMFDIYHANRSTGIPSFITTDALLHGFHLMFDHILLTCEVNDFMQKLDSLLSALAAHTETQHSQATDSLVLAALSRNQQFLSVAIHLLQGDTTFSEPTTLVTEEIELILNAQAQLWPSPIFTYPEDYTQYKPRGHYTKSAALEQYFRAMMWLGRMTFSCENDLEYAKSMTRSAILLTQAISQIQIDGRPGMEIWDDIYQPTVFFVGKSDDINFPQYLPLCYEVYGKSFPIYEPDTFANDTKLETFIQATEPFSGAKIGYPGQPSKGFRFMGQRFIPDSWILDELVFDKIPNRYMPTGLDVMLTLGHEKKAEQEWAFQHLPDRDKSDPYYSYKLDSLKTIFHSYADEVWAQNAYWNWLYCFMPLLMPKGQGYPHFMQTNAWRDKDLYAALASWAELRHDTILYAKQSGTETGMPPVAGMLQGYVEPNPHFYARMTALANFMIKGLQSRNLLFESFNVHLTRFAGLSEKLLHISIAELSGARLRPHDYVTIFEFGRTLYDIVTFQDYIPSGGLQQDAADELDPMPVVADVHYDANSGTVLEEAVGYPFEIYVICTIEGRPVLTRGAGFSYYEFTQPASNRLTDEQWRTMLSSSSHPETPAWASSFVLDSDVEPASHSFYEWHNFETMAFQHNVPETLAIGQTLNFYITSFYELPSHTPTLEFILSNGQRQTNPVFWDADHFRWTVSVETESWPIGTTYIEIKRDNPTLFYRTHLEIKRNSNVAEQEIKPRHFALYQNYPNPFNPQTMFKIETAKTSFIQLEVYDIRGRKVRTLVSSTQPAGLYFVAWDGTDDNGVRLTSGIYYYRMQAGDFTDVKRMILLR